MQPGRRTRRISVWRCLPIVFGALTFGLLVAPPTTVLHAASNTSPIVDAARAGDMSTVRSLIKDHADVNALANDGSSALLWAAYHSDVEMTKALLAAGARA